MRLVLHPKVFSDIDEIMGYYERIATRELADEFYSELDITYSRSPRGRNPSRFASVISAA